MRYIWLLVLGGCRGEAVVDPPAPAPVVAAAPASKVEETPVVAAPVADPGAQLVGEWKPDLTEVATDPDLLRLPKAAQAEAIQAASRILERIGLRFGADGTVTLEDGEATRSGRYSIERREGGAMTVRVSLAREEESPREEVLEVAFEGEVLKVTAGEGKSQRFVRR